MIIVLTDHLKGQGRPAFRQFDGPRVVPGEETQIGLAVGSQVDGLLWAGGIDFLPRLRIDAVLKLRSDMVGSDPQVILTSLGYLNFVLGRTFFWSKVGQIVISRQLVPIDTVVPPVWLHRLGVSIFTFDPDRLTQAGLRGTDGE